MIIGNIIFDEDGNVDFASTGHYVRGMRRATTPEQAAANREDHETFRGSTSDPILCASFPPYHYYRVQGCEAPMTINGELCAAGLWSYAVSNRSDLYKEVYGFRPNNLEADPDHRPIKDADDALLAYFEDFCALHAESMVSMAEENIRLTKELDAFKVLVLRSPHDTQMAKLDALMPVEGSPEDYRWGDNFVDVDWNSVSFTLFGTCSLSVEVKNVFFPAGC